ncbi:hypothetical protein [Moorena sp. SIO4G3]|uniref:hypothetical protein n=1 Tax=Moorena sp. SIO4G3 TaxID=2607821 RepID=UPI00142A504F|nr:hypothetical protein [Moorena sp. SIO4G3]NEO78023.1 YbjN domain-containing protein [Moorena sp. SIO4G3]
MTYTEFITDILKKNGWPFEVLSDNGVIQTLYSTGEIELNGYIHMHERKRMVVFYTIHPKQAPTNRRHDVLEYINWANFNIFHGSFEMHPINESLRFKTCINIGIDPLTPDLVRQLLIGNVIAHLRYGVGLAAIIDDGASLEDACRKMENG